MKNIVCPISTKRIDSNVSRLTIFMNVILMGFFLATQQPTFIIIVAVDYFIRAVMDTKYSPIRLLASIIIKTVGLKEKLIDLAPKVFASRLGFLCALTSSVLVLLDYTAASLIIAGVLMILSIMDSLFNFCVGCMIYHYLVYPRFKEKIIDANNGYKL